ncbi:MAG: glycoside hydrolase family 28 protein [Mangrovibacterium sp.]
MKNLIFMMLLALANSVFASESERRTVEEIVSKIAEPTIPNYQISITKFGGKGDGAHDNVSAFQKAFQHLSKHGGGSLFIPAGDYYCDGPIHLISHLELKFEKGARLFFSSNYEKFLPAVETSWEGTFIYNYSPFIYAKNCTNIKLSGEGVIDGEAKDTWATWRAKQATAQQRSRNYNHDQTNLSQRVFGSGDYLRPQLIQFFDCQNVLIEGIQLEDSPFWCLHLLRCEQVIVRGISFDAFNANNDGIDPEYSRNVLIEDVTFNNGDDNVAIKAGRDVEGRLAAHGTENIVVRNCSFKGLHALVVGSEMSAGVQHVYVENCTFGGYLKRGIYLKSNPDRGGFIKHIYVNNVEFGETEDCLFITSYYHNQGEGHVTVFEDIYFSNIKCKSATNAGIVLQGFKKHKLEGVALKNIYIENAHTGLSMENTENIRMSDVVIGKPIGAPSAVGVNENKN